MQNKISQVVISKRQKQAETKLVLPVRAKQNAKHVSLIVAKNVVRKTVLAKRSPCIAKKVFHKTKPVTLWCIIPRTLSCLLAFLLIANPVAVVYASEDIVPEENLEDVQEEIIVQEVPVEEEVVEVETQENIVEQPTEEIDVVEQESQEETTTDDSDLQIYEGGVNEGQSTDENAEENVESDSGEQTSDSDEGQIFDENIVGIGGQNTLTEDGSEEDLENPTESTEGEILSEETSDSNDVQATEENFDSDGNNDSTDGQDDGLSNIPLDSNDATNTNDEEDNEDQTWEDPDDTGTENTEGETSNENANVDDESGEEDEGTSDGNAQNGDEEDSQESENASDDEDNEGEEQNENIEDNGSVNEDISDDDTTQNEDSAENDQQEEGEMNENPDDSNNEDEGVVGNNAGNNFEQDQDTTQSISTSSDTLQDHTGSTTVAATTTEETPEESEENSFGSSTPAVNIATTPQSKYVFGDSECVLINDDEFYCIRAGDPSTEKETLFQGEHVKVDIDIEGDKEIFFVDVNGSVQITNNQVDDDAPAYDKAGSLIVWQALIKDRWQILAYDRDSGITEQITNTSFNNTNPQIDNGKIVWQGWAGSGWEIFLAEKNMTDGFTVKQITQNSWHDMFPQISNGLVTWQASIDGGWQVFVYDIATGATSRVGEGGDGKYENPRFVILLDNKKDNGDVETIGYDIITGETIPLGSHVPRHNMPESIPESPTQDQSEAIPQTGTSSLSVKQEDDPDSASDEE